MQRPSDPVTEFTLFWKCWLMRRGVNRSTSQRKTSQNKGENQQQTQPTYCVETGI